jgi:transmembrane sensor
VTEPSDRQDEIDRAAAAWVARLDGDPLSDAERRHLERWLDEDPAHAAVFDEARSALATMDGLGAAPGALARDIVPPSYGSAARRSAGARRPSRRVWARAAAIAACLLLVVGAGGVWFGDPLLTIAADHRTAPGERRLVTLADGSEVELGPASAIAVRYDADRRRVTLLAGLAYFTAAPRTGGEHRPFVVEAANGAAYALGTQFMVNRLPDAVEVTVTEHEVRVVLAEAGGVTRQVVLSPGQSVRYASAGVGRVREGGLDRVEAWRRDRLIFDHARLGDVVAELNRYRRGRIVIADPALAARAVSGLFETRDPDAALATIAREFGIRTAAVTPLLTLLY